MTLAEHRLSRTWLLRKLTEPADGPTLVVTHHVPHSAARHPGHGLNELAPAFCSDCDGPRPRPACRMDLRSPPLEPSDGDARREALSAQLGYPGEDTGWTGPGYLEI